MEEQIRKFTDQFAWEAPMVREESLPAHFSHVIVCAMGGSHLGARFLLEHDPTLPISVHPDYGLPKEPRERLETALIIPVSYSGETEETLDAAEQAIAAGLSVAVVTTGGALERLAETHGLPLILIPKKAAEPRMSVGAQMLALARLMRRPDLEEAVRAAGTAIQVEEGRGPGAALAQSLVGSIPLVYASAQNASTAFFWKIAFNETAKIPAFTNVFPELCHNELSGFDTAGRTRELSVPLHVLMLEDKSDHPRVMKRMRLMQDLLTKNGIKVVTIPLEGDSFEKSFKGILLGVWTAVLLAQAYGVQDATTPLIAEFKNKMIEP